MPCHELHVKRFTVTELRDNFGVVYYVNDDGVTVHLRQYGEVFWDENGDAWVPTKDGQRSDPFGFWGQKPEGGGNSYG